MTPKTEHITGKTEHIWREGEHIARKTEHIGRESEHIARKNWTDPPQEWTHPPPKLTHRPKNWTHRPEGVDTSEGPANARPPHRRQALRPLDLCNRMVYNGASRCPSPAEEPRVSAPFPYPPLWETIAQRPRPRRCGRSCSLSLWERARVRVFRSRTWPQQLRADAAVIRSRLVFPLLP